MPACAAATTATTETHRKEKARQLEAAQQEGDEELAAQLQGEVAALDGEEVRLPPCPVPARARECTHHPPACLPASPLTHACCAAVAVPVTCKKKPLAPPHARTHGYTMRARARARAQALLQVDHGMLLSFRQDAGCCTTLGERRIEPR
jgi:hypothetical protein